MPFSSVYVMSQQSQGSILAINNTRLNKQLNERLRMEYRNLLGKYL